MAGAVVTFTFGGTNYNTTPIIAVFPKVTLLDIITGLARGEGAVALNKTPVPAATSRLLNRPAWPLWGRVWAFYWC
jgi:hypothetical protein